MWIANVYNYNAGDDFLVFGKTKDDVINEVVKAYSKYYGMDDEDAKIYNYSTLKEYICEEKSMTIYESKLGGVYLNGVWRDESWFD